MRFALYSDLHLEIKAWAPPVLDVDVVILAGDIGSHTHGLTWAAARFQQPVIYVAGNHEYYDAHLGMLAELQQPAWEHAGIYFLEKSRFELNGVRFLGCTLWSGFDLYGADKTEAYMAVAKRGINDYWMIHARGGKRLEPRDTLKLHRTAVRWLDAELAKPFTGKTVVITHFAPHRDCVAPQYEKSDVSPYFVTDLSRLMEKHQIDVWCHGHTHTNTDFWVPWKKDPWGAEGSCRVISNQLGYPREQADIGFRPDLVIEL